LIELMVVITVIGVLAGAGTWGWAAMLEARALRETQRMLDSWRQSLEIAYKDNLSAILATSGPQLNLASSAVVNAVAPNAAGACSASLANVMALAGYLSVAGEAGARDGYNNGLCVFVTDVLSTTISGYVTPYKTIAVISTGDNGRLDTSAACTTGLSAGGDLVVCGDDQAVLIDGRKFGSEALAVTVTRLQQLTAFYQSYFATRYAADPVRDATVNYFAMPFAGESSFDAGGTIPQSRVGAVCAPVPLDTVSAAGPRIYELMGMSLADVRDGFGSVMSYDNCSGAVNNPFNVTPARAVPPYTAQFLATPPGMTPIVMTAIGQI
jgi:type II secretory pathway pseudopilin PulG